MSRESGSKAASSGPAQGLPRKLTAIGTVGEQNQLFTVFEKNWDCPECGQENYARRLVFSLYLTAVSLKS
jgi:rubredoxin